MRIRTLTVLLTVAATLTVTSQPAIAHPARPRPHTYVVSTTPGDTPEGIEVTRGGTIYVTSVGTGAVYRGSVRDPQLKPWLPAGSDGRTSATGVHVDRWGRVLIAGASTSQLFLYDVRGRLLTARTAQPGSFLNDFTIAGDFVYVTDSAHNQIWRAPLTRHGLGELEPWLTRDRIQPIPYFLNGIVTDGRTLLVGEQGQDVTYRIDLRTRDVRTLEVTGANGVLSGDGYLLEGRRLYAVHNAGGGKYVTRLALLDATLSRAAVVADSQPGAPGATPTTIARDGARLLWVNSQLDAAPGTPPYTVSVVRGLR
ncbi:superoxide dismutase [Kribbella flavida DSM 17836]|uniref:Superoxide dismutase n=1 Tax=Kribbella flavida (strain DSM 17836 / JCM 10339 / NBRC 14399) TaxID=479435 RepID=D2PVU3_KRIFD|nr:superoxide dismutase [Kribbella flavida]ADB29600.1 superoxide dismutase [Kribbella flavida DSM 17836]